MATGSRSYFQLGSLDDMNKNMRLIVDCMRSQLPYAISIPKHFKYYDDINRMIERRVRKRYERTRLEAFLDIFRGFRANYFFSLLSVGFGDSGYTTEVHHDDYGVTVFFDPVARGN